MNEEPRRKPQQVSVPPAENRDRYHVTFKGPTYDITISGSSPETIADDYRFFEESLKKTLGLRPNTKTTKQNSAVSMSVVQGEAPGLLLELSLGQLSIPQFVIDGFVENNDNLSNWDTMFTLLHYRPTGLTNKQIRALAEELGKPIKFSWFDGEFHRTDNEGLVVSRRVPGSREKLYFLAEPAKKRAEKLIRDFETKRDFSAPRQ